MFTNIIQNISKRNCTTCKHVNIYLANEDILYCSHPNNIPVLSDKYYVDPTFVCPLWESK